MMLTSALRVVATKFADSYTLIKLAYFVPILAQGCVVPVRQGLILTLFFPRFWAYRQAHILADLSRQALQNALKETLWGRSSTLCARLISFLNAHFFVCVWIIRA